jgi:hypothetical protein
MSAQVLLTVMGLERRSRADQGQPGANPPGEEPGARPAPV